MSEITNLMELLKECRKELKFLRNSDNYIWPVFDPVKHANGAFEAVNAAMAKADALRKENEELRKAVDYVASFMSVEDGNEDEYCAACPYVSLNYEDFEMDLNYGLLRRGECENVWRQSLTDVIIRAASTRAARLAEEAEASHEQ